MFQKLINHSNSGYITKKNLEDFDLKSALDILEPIQEEFLANYLSMIPASYSNKWPVDKLHWWSRPAEYAFVLYHLINIILKSKEKLSILEVGPGCSFIPYTLSQHTNITSLDIEDIDPSVTKFWGDLSRSIGIKISDCNSRDAKDPSYDIIYSVSVVEHVASPELMVKRLIDQLANNGVLILTLDVDTSNLGDYGLTIDQLNRILNIENIDFTYALDNRSISHLSDIASPKKGWWINGIHNDNLNRINKSFFHQTYYLFKSFFNKYQKKSDPRNISVLKIIGKKINPINNVI